MSTDTDKILERMREVFGVHYDNELAKCLDVPKTTLSNWKQRNSTPYPLCVQVAKEKGVSLDWLLTGEGEMLKAASKATGQPELLDTKRLTLAIETVEEGLEVNHYTMNPDKKALLIMAVYDLFKSQTKDDKQSVLRLVQSIAA